jgi:hypothetical protein
MHQPLLALSNEHRLVVTLAEGSGSYGYVAGSSGSLSPTTFRGINVGSVRTVASIDDFFFSLQGVVAQDFFKSLRVQTTAGHFLGANSVSEFRSANASSFSNAGAISVWRWAWTGVFDPWENLTDATRFVQIVTY